MQQVVIVGGHGKVALLAARSFSASGWEVRSLIRNPEHRDDVAETGAEPVLLDIESADVDDLTNVFSGADAVVFSAGAGGGNPARTNAVDFEAATRTIDAAQGAEVRRYVMVSYAGAATDVERLDAADSFYPYARAKHDADAYLRESPLDYTILGPGLLTLEPATGKIRVVSGRGEGEELDDDERVTSRANVAEVITHVLTAHAASRRTVNFYDGEVPISEALA